VIGRKLGQLTKAVKKIYSHLSLSRSGYRVEDFPVSVPAGQDNQ